MKIFLILIFSFFTATAFAQEYPDSGFTNKAEAKNLMVHGLKEGKWVEYIKKEWIVDGNDTVTKDTNAANFYSLTVYKAGKPYGMERDYSKDDNLWELFLIIPYKGGKEDGIEKTLDIFPK